MPTPVPSSTDPPRAVRHKGLGPVLAAQLHPSRNGPLRPEDVRPYSRKVVWWKCGHGREWQASPQGRRKSPRCPCQLGRGTSLLEIRVVAELTGLFPHAVWRARLAGVEVDCLLGPERVAVEVDGHWHHLQTGARDARKTERLAAAGFVVLRVRQAPLPPLADTDVVCAHAGARKRDLDALVRLLLPHVSAELRPRLETYLGQARFQSEPGFQALAARCQAPPPGQSLAERHPALAAEWDTQKNGGLRPDHVSSASNQRVWWRCTVDPDHRWEATVGNRVGRGSGCRFCSGKAPSATNNLAVVRPDLAAEWHPVNPIPPSEVTPQSHRRVWWRCARGHVWSAVVQSRTQGRGCPVCSGKHAHPDTALATRYPALAAEWDAAANGALGPGDVTRGSHRRVRWVCPAGHRYVAAVCERVRGRGCPECGRTRSLARLIAARRQQAIRQRANRLIGRRS